MSPRDSIRTLTLSFLVTALCIGRIAVHAQTINFSVPVTFHYDGKTLSAVLDDLTNKYNVGFSYSRQIIPVHQRIYADCRNVPFGEAIDLLFAQTQVIYGVIGDQIVLSIDVHKVPVPPDMGLFGPGYDDSLASMHEVPRMQYEVMHLATHENFIQYTPTSRINPVVVEYILREQVKEAERKQSNVRVQVTFIPPLQADTHPEGEQPLSLSFNLLAGANKSVEGMEMGGFVNILSEDMTGIQTSGIVNIVGDDFQGVQAAGLFNRVQGTASGVQAAGLMNVAGGGSLLQGAGFMNIARGDVHGQAAGLVNVARNVRGAQVAGLVNVAQYVQGTQIGLFNFADSVGGLPIGLMTIVRKRGYHSLELAGEDAIDYNLNLRLGVRAFYNILHAGLDEQGETWSLGYGIGTSIFITRRNYLQFEVLSRQINEGETWTDELNLLSQLRMTYDFALGRNFRFAIGPSFNVSTSRRYDEQTGQYGTQVPRYVMFEHTYDDGYHLPLNVKYWVGLQIGIRFGTADWIPEHRN